VKWKPLQKQGFLLIRSAKLAVDRPRFNAKIACIMGMMGEMIND
jgi:hypothetical protein